MAEEQAEHLPPVPLQPSRIPAVTLRSEDRVQVRHVSDRFQEVETEAHRGAIHDPIDDIVEVVPHDEEKEHDGETLGELLEQSRRERG